jgi:hypothetical protein
LYRPSNLAIGIELLSYFAVFRKRPADGICGAADGARGFELGADGTVFIESWLCTRVFGVLCELLV